MQLLTKYETILLLVCEKERKTVIPKYLPNVSVHKGIVAVGKFVSVTFVN